MAFTSATSSVTSYLHRRAGSIKDNVRQKGTISGWVLPKQTTTFADEGTWSNIDTDVTPIERRTWSTWTLLGFWFSDALNAQGWQVAASIMAVGLTWYVCMPLTARIQLCGSCLPCFLTYMLSQERGSLLSSNWLFHGHHPAHPERRHWCPSTRQLCRCFTFVFRLLPLTSRCRYSHDYCSILARYVYLTTLLPSSTPANADRSVKPSKHTPVRRR